MTKRPQWPSDVRPLLFNLALVGFLLMVAVALITTNRWEWHHYVVAITCAGFVAVLGNLDKIESFKAGAGGIEAKTRAIVQRAESAINELHLVAEATASTLLSILDGGDRWGGLTAADKDAQRAQLFDAMRRIGVSEERIAEIRAIERRWVVIDYVGAIADMLPRDPNRNGEWAAMWAPYKGSLDRPSPSELRSMLLPFGDLEPWREQLLLDYEHYVRTGEHRRPKLWGLRDVWPEWSRQNCWPPEYQ